ncbi:MAG: carboxypeptidase-like regulatory domain-containing protein [bacterium]
MRRYLLPVIFGLLGRSLSAQSTATGRLEGVVSSRGVALAVGSASISLTRLEPEPSVSFTSAPDTGGRYLVDSLPAGRYLLQLSSPLLDSLELALAPEEVLVVAGRTARADLLLPTGARLRDAVCPGVSLDSGLVAVAGRATDADTEQPIAGADVVVSWTDVEVSRTTLKTVRQDRSAVVKSGTRGEYRLCGVPSGVRLSMQLQHERRAGAVVELSVSDDDGAAARDLSLSARDAPTIAALDSMERLAALVGVDSTTGELLLTGTSSIAGRVHGPDGLPLAGAQVHVRDARGTATSGIDGAFHLADLPAGTQVLLVRRLGYALSEQTVELREGKRLVHDVQLTRAVSLDSVRVTALGSRYRDFDFARKANILGRFLTRDQIERRNVVETGDLLARLGAFTVVGRGRVAKVFTKSKMLVKRDPRADELCSEVNVVIDGVQDMGINDVPPARVVGLEAYTGPTTFSSNYRASCGLIVIWTTAWRRDAVGRPIGSSRSGSPPR